jgi:protein-tyrosine phosphatase
MALLAASGLPAQWLFVCHGNICRSPYAMMRARALLGHLPDTKIVSAGFVGAGRRSPSAARQAAEERGLDLTTHRATYVTHELGAAARLIIVMDRDQRNAMRRIMRNPKAPVVLLGDFDPESIKSRTIVDPIGQPVAAFHACYTRIDRCVQAMVDALVPPASR